LTYVKQPCNSLDKGDALFPLLGFFNEVTKKKKKKTSLRKSRALVFSLYLSSLEVMRGVAKKEGVAQVKASPRRRRRLGEDVA